MLKNKTFTRRTSFDIFAVFFFSVQMQNADYNNFMNLCKKNTYKNTAVITYT